MAEDQIPEAKTTAEPAVMEIPAALSTAEHVSKAPAKPVGKITPAPKKKSPAASKPKPALAAADTKKEIPMAKTADITSTITEAMTEMETRAKAAYEKSALMATEMGDFTKGNVEAMVEAGSILTASVQDISKTLVEDAKSAFEVLTADMKEMAAVKSPTDLFQLQGKLMRRNFDSLVAMSSQSSETMLKLANDVMAPLSGRMSLAAEKLAKVA